MIQSEDGDARLEMIIRQGLSEELTLELRHKDKKVWGDACPRQRNSKCKGPEVVVNLLSFESWHKRQKVGLPWWSSGWSPPADAGNMGLIPGLERSPTPWNT